jgi:hypothetical protein
MEPPILVERGIKEPTMKGDPQSVRDVISRSEPSRGTCDLSFNSLGLLSFENRKLSFRSRKGRGGPEKLEKQPTNERDSPCAVATPRRRPLLAFFSSLSSNLNPWPSSPLANKIDKSLGKRKAALLDENGNAMSGGIAQQKKVDRKASPKGYLVDHNSSPDYKMLLNLSDTPSQVAVSGDPFTQSQFPARIKSTYYISTSRDASLSPTIKNPSLGSLDSEEISAVCLAPPRERRSPSYGLFACSGYLGDGQSDDTTEASKPIDMEDIEKRRIGEAMERWAKTGISISDTTSIELYKSPPADDHVRRRPMIALAPPRPVDRLSLEQQSRALDRRPQYGPVSGLADSNGLLDAVCEAEAMVLQRNVCPGWAFTSLAPADMHLRPTSISALTKESQSHVPKPNEHQPISVAVKQNSEGLAEAERNDFYHKAKSPGLLQS